MDPRTLDWQFSKIKAVVLTQDHSSKKRIKRTGQRTYLEPPVRSRKCAHLLKIFKNLELVGYFILNPFLKIQNWEFFNFQNLEPEVITKNKEPPNTSIDLPNYMLYFTIVARQERIGLS